MRLYETAFLIAPNLPEEEMEKLINDLAAVVSKKKGKMENIDNWGKKRMAYPIDKFDEAFYVFFHYRGEPGIPMELERRFKQTEPIIRYMTLKQDERENIRDKKKQRRPRRAAASRPRKEEAEPEPQSKPITDAEAESPAESNSKEN